MLPDLNFYNLEKMLNISPGEIYRRLPKPRPTNRIITIFRHEYCSWYFNDQGKSYGRACQPGNGFSGNGVAPRSKILRHKALVFFFVSARLMQSCIYVVALLRCLPALHAHFFLCALSKMYNPMELFLLTFWNADVMVFPCRSGYRPEDLLFPPCCLLKSPA